MTFHQVLDAWPFSRVPRFMLEWSAYTQQDGDVVILVRLTEPGYDNEWKPIETMKPWVAYSQVQRPEDHARGLFSTLTITMETLTSPIDTRAELDAMIAEGRWD